MDETPPKPQPSVSPSVRWASARHFPIGVESGGDGVEDLLGPTVGFEGPNPLLYVSLFDGKSFRQRYRVGPFGAPQGRIEVVAAGKRFVVLDARGDAHLYELADGKLVGDFAFQEEAQGLCGPPASQTQVVVKLTTGTTRRGNTSRSVGYPFVIETSSGIGKPARAEPAWCTGRECMRRRVSESFNGFAHMQADLLRDESGVYSPVTSRLRVPPKADLYTTLLDGDDVVGVAEPAGSIEMNLLGFDSRGTRPSAMQVPAKQILPVSQIVPSITFV